MDILYVCKKFTNVYIISLFYLHVVNIITECIAKVRKRI